MLKIMTLPITPNRRCSFLTLVTPFVADIYARSIGAELTIVLNTTGIKSESYGMSPADQYKNYIHLLLRLGMGSIRCVHDGTDLYESFFQSEMIRIKEMSLLQRLNRTVAWCSCGRVEIPVDVALKIIADQRHKTLIRGSNLENATCAVCHSSLNTGDKDVSHIWLPKENIDVEPCLYAKEIEAIVERTAERDVIVTRHHRGIEEKFDTDFRWYGYVGCFAKPGDEVVIITSPTTLNQAVKVFLYSKMAYPDIKIRLCVHSLIRIIDHKIKMSKMNIDEFLALLNPLQARMFLSLGIQWTALESFIGTNEVYLIKQTSQKITEGVQSESGCFSQSLQNVFTRRSISSLYKSIRRDQTLSPEQLQLLRLIQPPM